MDRIKGYCKKCYHDIFWREGQVKDYEYYCPNCGASVEVNEFEQNEDYIPFIKFYRKPIGTKISVRLKTRVDLIGFCIETRKEVLDKLKDKFLIANYCGIEIGDIGIVLEDVYEDDFPGMVINTSIDEYYVSKILSEYPFICGKLKMKYNLVAEMRSFISNQCAEHMKELLIEKEKNNENNTTA